MISPSGTRIFLKPEISEVFRHFSTLFGIRIAFFTPDGKALDRGVHAKGSGFCRFVDQGIKQRSRCLMQDHEKRLECGASGKMLVYRCHAGLVEAVSPVYAGRDLLGYIMIGQFRDSMHPLDNILFQKANSRQRKRLREEYDRLVYVSKKRKESLLFVFKALVELVVAKNWVEIKKGLLVQKVMEYIAAHLHENVTLSQVARFCCKSGTTITHEFRRQTGQSFKSYLLTCKIEKAESMIRQQPDLSLSSVAESLGFSDLFHFSKTYKKIRGTTPSALRRRAGTLSF